MTSGIRYGACIFAALAATLLSTEISAQNWPPTIAIRGQEYRVAPYDQIRDLGLETTYIARIRNAAVYYIEAINQYPELGDHDSVLWRQFDYALSYAWMPEFQELEDWLPQCEPMMESLRRAYGKSRCVWPVFAEEKATIADVLLPHLQHMRHIARILAVRARRALSNGDFDTAKESFDIAFRMSEHLGEDQFLISGLVALAVRAIAERKIHDLALTHTLTVAQIEELLDVIEPYVGNPLDCKLVMEGEKNFELRIMRDMFENPGACLFLDGDDPQSTLKALYYINKVTCVPRIISQTQIREYWKKHHQILDRPFHEYLRILNKPGGTQELEEIGGIASIMSGSISRAREQYARAELAMNVLELTLAMEIYKKKHGEYPDRLNRLFGIIREIPMDPFSGDDLICRPGEDGYVLYSVGTNQIDDGGYVSKDYSPWSGKDFVYTSTARPIAPYEPAEENDNTTPR